MIGKHYWLGAAALLVMGAGAQAADLPFRKAAPVDYVRVCDFVSGGGFFYIPGTDTCLRISGAARFEYAFVNPTTSFYANPFLRNLPIAAAPGIAGNIVPSRQRSASGFFERGEMDVDTRTQTAYGELRAFVRVRMDRYGGNYNANASFAPSGIASGAVPGGSGSSVYLDKGYVTFAGITAGRIQSFFDLYADDYNYEGIANSDESTQVLAYTATFGGGFSGTVSIEDPNGARRDGIGSIVLGNNAIGAAVNSGAGLGTAFGTTAGYGGLRFPDAVVQLRYDQSWGAVQLSGAYHDVNTVSAAAVGTNFIGSTASGFAVQAGVDLKLPMIAAGDELWVEGAYQQGAFLYQDSGANFSSGFYGSQLGGFQHLDVDAVAVGNPGTNGYHLALGEGFSGMLAFHHYFTQQFHDVLFGSYEEIGYGNQVRNIDWTQGGLGDAQEFRIGNQFIFTPVHNLDFGIEVLYEKLNQTLAHNPGVAASPIPTGIALNPDSYQVRLHVERDF